MRPPRWLAVGRLLLALGSVACGQVDAGSAQFVGAVRFKDPAGTYAISLLEPPWIPVVVLGVTVFIVPPSDATITVDVTHALTMALYSLQVERPAGAPTEAMEQVFAALPQGATVGPRTFTTAAGANGVEIAWQEATETFHRDAFIAGAGTQTFQLHFTGRHALEDDAMLTQMIASFASTPMVASTGAR